MWRHPGSRKEQFKGTPRKPAPRSLISKGRASEHEPLLTYVSGREIDLDRAPGVAVKHTHSPPIRPSSGHIPLPRLPLKITGAQNS